MDEKVLFFNWPKNKLIPVSIDTSGVIDTCFFSVAKKPVLIQRMLIGFEY